MKPHFIWKNKSSLEYKLIINKIPPRIKPQLRGETIEIPGRNGSLFESEEVYNSKSIEIECTLISTNEEETERIMMELPIWLDGFSKLILSDYPEYYYEAKIINVIPIERLFKRYRKFPLTFEIQPFSKTLQEYEINKTTTQEEIFNINSYYPVSPILEVVGSGNITIYINNQPLYFKDIINKIVIDCEFMNAIDESGINVNNKVNGLPFVINGPECNTRIILENDSTFESLKIKYRGLWI